MLFLTKKRFFSCFILSMCIGYMVISCQSESSGISTINHAFYFWQSHFKLDNLEKQYIEGLQVRKLYVRFFDVDWNPHQQKALPVGDVYLKNHTLTNTEIIPTVFITNRTLLHISDKEVSTLGKNIVKKIQEKSGDLELSSPSEIQVDCDWSGKTREKFFRLLREIRKNLTQKNTNLSVTIRLHQLKYPQHTGVPPVDKGMLMFYNMGDIQKTDTRNSILDLEIAQDYLQNARDYPLHLDLALPLFSWGVVRRRDKVVHLLHHLTPGDLQNQTKYQSLYSKNYQVMESHYQRGVYLYKGDKIRIEDIQLQDLKDSADMLKKIIAQDSLTITYYHLDSRLLKRFSIRDLQEVSERF